MAVQPEDTFDDSMLEHPELIDVQTESETAARFVGVPEPYAGVYNKALGTKNAFIHSQDDSIVVKHIDGIWKLQKGDEWIGRLLTKGDEGPFARGWWFRLSPSFRNGGGWVLGPSGFAKARKDHRRKPTGKTKKSTAPPSHEVKVTCLPEAKFEPISSPHIYAPEGKPPAFIGCILDRMHLGGMKFFLPSRRITGLEGYRKRRCTVYKSREKDRWTITAWHPGPAARKPRFLNEQCSDHPAFLSAAEDVWEMEGIDLKVSQEHSPHAAAYTKEKDHKLGLLRGFVTTMMEGPALEAGDVGVYIAKAEKHFKALAREGGRVS